ncbi:transporter substrate-binding domain-containing protein [Cohnella ginsengisoli]|uniref:Transporter substrate-binding domain-containing protein n=1 Tax=Cohnella ginsengisoli TaxID=425004 RepID=A0A9X4KIE6_9BACL|nr:transporter substrate-binding domain-containing protein [Cohnella ginsengisoli]MDG0792809.1 transporter substrate-binding domain-containing protein [Cohnella ginsengisoli]
MLRKLTSIILTAALAVGLSACGAKESSNANAGVASSADAGEITLKFATDASYAPMESMDKDKIVGFDVDFLDAVMKEAGYDYKLDNTGWDPLFADLGGGNHKYDGGISSISITDDRKQTFDFTVPYFESVNMILTKENKPVKDALELKDKKVAVQGGTTAETLMKGIMGDDNPNLKRFDSNTLALMELESNGVDAVVADFAVVQSYVQQNPDKKFNAIYDRTNFASEYYGILLPKDTDPAVKEKIDAAVEKVRASDEYKAIYKKWIGVEPDTSNLVTAK